MTWLQRYRVKEFFKSSFWLFPALAFAGGWLIGKLILWYVPDPHWPRFDQNDIDGLRTVMAALASSMLTFIVYAVSALLLAVQIASGQITPRLIRITFSRWQVKVGTSLFVFAFVVTLVALTNMTDESRHSVLLLLAIVSNIASVLVFFWFVESIGLGMRPVAILQSVFVAGKDAMDAVYPGQFEAGRPEQGSELTAAAGEGRIVRRRGASGTFLAFGSRDLVALAGREGCMIELIPQVGDFVSTDDPLARVYPATSAIGDEAIDSMVAFGPERTTRQDPLFAFRIMVDVASRALSPAVNDPTTAVLAIDQIHRLLRYAGNRNLGNGEVRDASGAGRLVIPTPTWEDIVGLAVTEIRHYGASSVQVARRLRAMLEHLIDRLPEVRRNALERELSLLESSVSRSFVDGEDRRTANLGDFQGLGGSSVRADV